MTTIDENTLFEEENVKITNKRVVIGAKTYSLENITSVDMEKKIPSMWFGLIMLGFGLVIIFWGWSLISNCEGDCLGVETAICLPGFIMVSIGIVFFLVWRPYYIVKFGSASDESNVLQARDREKVQRIVDATNEAIIQHE